MLFRSALDEEDLLGEEVEEDVSEFCAHTSEDGVKCRNHARPGSRYCGIHSDQE